MLRRIPKFVPLVAGMLLMAMALYFIIVPNMAITESRECGEFI